MIQRSQEYQRGAIYIRGSFPPYNIILAQSQAIFNLQLLDTHQDHSTPDQHSPRGHGAGRIAELLKGAEGYSGAAKREKTASLSNNNTLPLSIYIIPHLAPISQVFFYTIILTFWARKKGEFSPTDYVNYSATSCLLITFVTIQQFGAKAEVAYSATS